MRSGARRPGTFTNTQGIQHKDGISQTEDIHDRARLQSGPSRFIQGPLFRPCALHNPGKGDPAVPATPSSLIGRLTMLAVLMLTAVLAGCGGDAGDVPAQAETRCRNVALADRFGTDPIRGVEDLAIDHERGLIYLSAYDRFALEDAIAAKSRTLPRGGLYAAPLSAILDADNGTTVTVRELTGAFVGPNDFRTHGIDLYTPPLGDQHLAAVVHRYGRADRGEKVSWRRQSGVAFYRVTPAGLEQTALVFHPELCHANDLAVVGPRTVLVTRDHGACGSFAAAEDVLGLKRARVMKVTLNGEGKLDRDPVPLAGGIGFANGIAVDRSRRRVIIAATREQALLIYDLERLLSGDAGHPQGRIALDGAPDNLTLSPDGHLLSGVHPSLLQIGFYRRRWFGETRAPARVLAINLDTAKTRLAYQDSEGARFPAVTVAAGHDEVLVMGSVGAEGLLVCPRS